jgi:hypothetical protein
LTFQLFFLFKDFIVVFNMDFDPEQTLDFVERRNSKRSMHYYENRKKKRKLHFEHASNNNEFLLLRNFRKKS